MLQKKSWRRTPKYNISHGKSCIHIQKHGKIQRSREAVGPSVECQRQHSWGRTPRNNNSQSKPCTYNNLGEYTETEELDVHVFNARNIILGEEHPYTISAKANLAATYRNLGKYKEAENLQIQVLHVGNKILGEEHPGTILAMGNLGSTYSNLGKYTEAGGLYTPTAFPSRLRADSIGLRVSRMHIFLLFHHSIFPMIFRCLSGHFWSDHKVQRTFPMDFQWTNSKPTPK